MSRSKVEPLGRKGLLSWVNATLDTDYEKIEHLCDGIAYMQLLDSVFPGKVPLERLNFMAEYESECVENLNILDDTFEKCGVPRRVPVERLSKGRFVDNFEFMQWMHQYVMEKDPDGIASYDPRERRRMAQRYVEGDDEDDVPLPHEESPASSTREMEEDAEYENGRRTHELEEGGSVAFDEDRDAIDAKGGGGTAAVTASGTSFTSFLSPEHEKLLQYLVNDLQEILETETQTMRDLDSKILQAMEERDFYFDKLVNIEAVCSLQDDVSKDITTHLLEILHESHPAFDGETKK